MNDERLLDGNETQVANQFFIETRLPTFPYKIIGIMRKRVCMSRS